MKLRKGKTSSILRVIRLIQNQENKVALLNELGRKKIVLSFVNLHAVYLCLTNKSFYEAVKQSDIVLRDGIGVSLLMKIFRLKAGMNMVGTDFIPEILNHYNNSRTLLIGTDITTVKIASEKLKGKGIKVIDQCDGFQSKEFYEEFVSRTQPEIVVLGMGMPKQELVAQYLSQAIDNDFLVINGGAIIDYIGLKVSRAPGWMRKLRLEWFYRFICEPRRLFTRYFVEPFKLIFLLIGDIFFAKID